MAVTTLSTHLLADDLTATAVTEIVQDPSSGRYVREYRFFGAPADGSNEAPLLLIVRAQSPETEALKIKTPVLSI